MARGERKGANMSARMTFPVMVLAACLTGSAAYAQTKIIIKRSPESAGQPECGETIDAFIRAIDSDVETGNLNRRVHTMIIGDLRTILTTCRTGNAQDALKQLGSLKHRYGYH